MSNKNRVTFIPRSTSPNSLPVPFTIDNSIVTAPTTQALTSKIPVNIQRRRAIIPTPNIPAVVTKSSVMSDEQESSMTKKTDNQSTIQNNRDDVLRINPLVDEQYLKTSLHQKYSTAHATDAVSSVAVNSQDHRRMFIVDNDFEVFILDNFIAFSGKQNVILWLDQIEQKFDELRIGRNLRFKAIPVLIEGAAK